MAATALDALQRVVCALTYDHIERSDGTGVIATDEDIPLLQRSIGQDLREIEARLGLNAKGNTILSAIASSIDEALLAAAEAQLALKGLAQ
ncbi:MAG: hypothetical protein GW855_07845 [Erythrobacter sp.]|nr:hypothetical protein [Erythrobacter sp.]NCQ62450.1 hypothetical protein [Alphaproteobacteria bacterium]